MNLCQSLSRYDQRQPIAECPRIFPSIPPPGKWLSTMPSISRGPMASAVLAMTSISPWNARDLRYKANLHRAAEAARTSCAGCHAPGGTAFASEGECARCHTNLSTPLRTAASVSTSDTPGLPGGLRFDTSLGTATFDHAQHVTLAKGDCVVLPQQAISHGEGRPQLSRRPASAGRIGADLLCRMSRSIRQRICFCRQLPAVPYGSRDSASDAANRRLRVARFEIDRDATRAGQI